MDDCGKIRKVFKILRFKTSVLFLSPVLIFLVLVGDASIFALHSRVLLLAL